jgi:hypothetical protein
LEWYCNSEDYYCTLSACKLLLPRIWRYENVRERQRLAELEYHRLTANERKPRLLDDIWPQLWALFPQLIDIFVGIPTLRSLEGTRRVAVVNRLENQLRQFERDLAEFTASAVVKEVLQLVDPPINLRSSHATCCPPIPFFPRIFQYPQAGFLRLMLFAIRTHMAAILVPLLRAESIPDSDRSGFEDLDRLDATASAYEQCRTFAGIEDAFGENQDNLFPCFSSLILAGMSCPPGIRMWLWYKLAHFENLGQFCFDPIKKYLALWWNMPSLLTDGFGPWKGEPPDRQFGIVSVEDFDLATKLASQEDGEERDQL